MVRSKVIYISLIISVLCACHPRVESPRNMVLEGWIEAGEEPVVLLHYAYALDENNNLPDTATLEDVMREQMVTLAKVTISDGEDEVVLTNSYNSHYMPPLVYSTTHLVGEAGKTYTITASRNGDTVRAVTTIPAAQVAVESLSVKTDRDSVVSVVARIDASGMSAETYVVLFLRKEGEYQLVACPVGAVCIPQGEKVNVPVYTAVRGGFGVSHFHNTDSTRYYLHVATVDEVSYAIWQGINAQSINQGMFFMGIYHNMPSNVSSGRGYWCGYHAREYPFVTTRDTVYL